MSFVNRRWKYLSICLIAVFGVGIVIPTASAANPTLEQILDVLLGIQQETDNLPADPASQSKIGETKAITNWFSQQLGDGEVYNGFPLLGDDFDGKNRSGQVSVYSWPSSEEPAALTLFCGIAANEHTGMNGIIAYSEDGFINTTFSCTSLSLGILDVQDGDDPEENIIIDIQYVETENLTITVQD
jgi:hypothetical protein